MRKAVYAGSFDPVTRGHLWMIEQAAKLFDSLIVAVGDNYKKNYTFTLEQRVSFLESLTSGYSNIEVSHFTNEFLVNYAKRVGVNYIVRGIRNSQDYEFEKTMRHVNSDLDINITTVFLLPPRQFAEVSSSMVKGLVGSNGWEGVVTQYVPNIVLEALSQQHLLLQKSSK